jgi:hypothetical protein
MCHTIQPKCPECGFHGYRVVDGPWLSKTRQGNDVERYLLQCLKCNRRYNWSCPLGWRLASNEDTEEVDSEE